MRLTPASGGNESSYWGRGSAPVASPILLGCTGAFSGGILSSQQHPHQVTAKLAPHKTPREFLCAAFAKMVFWLPYNVLFQKKN